MVIPLLFNLTLICDTGIRDTACVCNNKILFVKTYYKSRQENKALVCAAAEVSLTEQKRTGDSVLLFVASSSASQFHFTLAYHFDLCNCK